MKVGIVGCGFMGRMHANVYGLLENAELVAVADKKPEVGQALATEHEARAYESMEAMLDSELLDVVDICLPTYLHRDYTVAALEAGKHVFCEKPMALTVADADHMAKAAKVANKALMIGHCIRFWPEYRMLKKIKDEGKLGRLLSINLTRYGEFPTWSSENWLADESKAGGGALDMHIHDTDYALYLLGEPDEMSSYGTVDERGTSYAFTTIQVGDCVAHLEGGWNLPPGTPFKMAFRAIFENGAAIMDGGPLTIYEKGKEARVPEFPKMQAAGGGNISDLGGYFHELKYFADRVSNGEPLETVTPESSRRSLEVTLQEIEQIKARAKVPVGTA